MSYYPSNSGSFNSFQALNFDELLNDNSNIPTQPSDGSVHFPFDLDKGESSYEVTVYDLRPKSGGFVKGTVIRHSCKEKEGIKRYIESKLDVRDGCIKFDGDENPKVALVLCEEQISDIQIFVGSPLSFEVDYTDMSGEVTRCISLHPDCQVGSILATYNDQTEASMNCIYFPRRQLVLQNGTFADFEIKTFDKVKLFQDTAVYPQIHFYMDQRREIILHPACHRSNCVGQIKTQLEEEFPLEFPCLSGNKLRLWILCAETVLDDADFPFLDEMNDVIRYKLTVQVSSKDSIIVGFVFENKEKTLVIPAESTVQDFREAISRVLHTGPERFVIMFQKRKCSDKERISTILKDSKRNVLSVQLAKEKLYKWAVVNSTVKTVDIMAYKQETISSVRMKLAVYLKEDPFYLQLLLNASKMDDEGTLYTHKVRSDDILQVVIFKCRVRLTIKRCRAERFALVVDEIDKTTVTDITDFCAEKWNMVSSNIRLIYKGDHLPNSPLLLQSYGVGSGDILVAVCTDGDCDIVVRFTASPYRTMTKEKFLNVRGQLVKVDDNFTFAPSSEHPLLSTSKRVKGISIDAGTHTRESQGGYPNVRCDLPVTPNIPMEVEPSTISDCVPSTLPVATCSSQSTCNEGITTVAVTPQRQWYYQGDDLVPNRNFAFENETYSTRSSDGIVHSVSRTRGIAPIPFPRLPQSLSDTALVVPTNPLLANPVFNLPEPKDAVPTNIITLVAKELGTNWAEVAFALGLEWKDHGIIKHNYQNDLVGQAQYMLQMWKNKKGSGATVEYLCKVLRECGLTIIAESVENLSMNKDYFTYAARGCRGSKESGQFRET